MVAGAQSKAADLRLRDINVVRARQKALLAQEAVAVLDDVEHALGEVIPCCSAWALGNAEREVRLANVARKFKAKALGKVLQLGDRLGFKLYQIHEQSPGCRWVGMRINWCEGCPRANPDITATARTRGQSLEARSGR